MKLHTTLTSPYGRIVRMLLVEKGLEDRVPVEVAMTRTPDSPYYAVNPSGRVPYLERDDGPGLEDSSLICFYLDHLDGEPCFEHPPGAAGLESRRLEAMARSLLDGLSVWSREYAYRPPELRSEVIIEHERARASRMLDVLETLVDSPVLAGEPTLAQLTLVSALHGRDGRLPGFGWRDARPRLSAWVDAMGERDSVRRTAPPAS